MYLLQWRAQLHSSHNSNKMYYNYKNNESFLRDCFFIVTPCVL